MHIISYYRKSIPVDRYLIVTKVYCEELHRAEERPKPPFVPLPITIVPPGEQFLRNVYNMTFRTKEEAQTIIMQRIQNHSRYRESFYEKDGTYILPESSKNSETTVYSIWAIARVTQDLLTNRIMGKGFENRYRLDKPHAHYLP